MRFFDFLCASMAVALVGCSSFVADSSSRKFSDLKSIAIGTDKAEVVKVFGAPQRIEIDKKKFRYTYIQKGHRKNPSRVSVLFDENNRVESKSY